MILAVFLWLEIKVLSSTSKHRIKKTPKLCHVHLLETAALVLYEGGGFFLKPLWVLLKKFLSAVKSSAKTVLFCLPYVITPLRAKCIQQSCRLRKN